MKKFILLIFTCLLIFSFASCSGSNEPSAPSNPTGNIQFQNQTSDTYYVDVEGYQTFTLGGGKMVTYAYPVGNYYVEVTQKTGYLFYPTVKSGTARVTANQTFVFYWN